MTQHHLQGRSENEILWFQRRSFLQAAAAWTALGGVDAALAQGRGNVVEMMGDIMVNGSFSCWAIRLFMCVKIRA